MTAMLMLIELKTPSLATSSRGVFTMVLLVFKHPPKIQSLIGQPSTKIDVGDLVVS